jgi:hypothetical protein
MTTGARIPVTPRSLTEDGLDAVAELEPLRRRNFTLVGAPTLVLCALRHVPWTSEALRHGRWERLVTVLEEGPR